MTARNRCRHTVGTEQGGFCVWHLQRRGCSIPRNTDSGTYIHVGPEIGVASTKAFTGQVTVLMLLALCVGQMRGTVDDATVERIVRELKNMPLYILKSASNLNGNLNCSKELEHYAS